MSSFVTDAGVHVTESETESGDYSFTWTEEHGLPPDTVTTRFELVHVNGKRAWKRLCWPDITQPGGGHNSLHWPWPAVNDKDEAREMVKARVGR